MNHASSIIMVERPPLSLWDKTATLIACALGGAIFLKIGWLAMEPADPMGAVSLFARPDGVMMLLQAAALAGVTAGLATLIAGRKAVDIGLLATVMGLALVSLRGASAEYLLIQSVEPSSTGEHRLALQFFVGVVGWFLVLVVAIATSAVMMRWYFHRSDPNHSDPLHPETIEWADQATPMPAGCDVPWISAPWLHVSADCQTAPRDGVRHTAIATGVGLVAMVLLSTGLSSRSIQHGQVCFVLAAGVCTGTYFAGRLVPVRSALWSILAVLLIAMVGYGWSMLRPTMMGLPPNIPSSHFMRALPIQFISVGAVAALMTFWSLPVPVSQEKLRPVRAGNL